MWNLIQLETYSPIFNNDGLLLGKRPTKFGQCRQWYDKGEQSLGKVFGDKGLKSFEDLSIQFNLQSSTFYFYSQLRTAMSPYGVPLQASRAHIAQSIVWDPGS